MIYRSLSHFLQAWLFPPGLILLLFFIGFVLLAYHRKSGKFMVALSFILFWLLSTHVITQHLIDGLQTQYPALSLATKDLDATHSAIVVLGSGVENAMEYAEKRTVSDKTLSRLHYAAYLYDQTHLPIIVSGGNRENTGITEADLMREILINAYRTPVLFVENKSHNTREEAMLLGPLLKSRGIQRIYLITHAWHMPRSMLAFKAAFKPYGITIIPAPMGYITLASTHLFSNYLPLLNGLNTSFFALHEYVGILWYRLFYRI